MRSITVALIAAVACGPALAAATTELQALRDRWIESTGQLVDAEILAARMDAAARIVEAAQNALPTADRSPLAHARLVLAAAKVDFYREYLESSFSAEVLTRLRSALDVVATAGDEALLADAQDLLGLALFLNEFRASDHAEARALLTAALETRRRLENQRGVAEALFHLGLTHEHRQDPGPADRKQARQLYEHSLSLAEAGGFDYEASYPIRHLAGMRDDAGDQEGARAGFERSLELRRRAGATLALAPALIALADVEIDLDEVGRARELYQEALTTARRIGATGAENAAREGLARLPPADG